MIPSSQEGESSTLLRPKQYLESIAFRQEREGASGPNGASRLAPDLL